MATFEAVGWMDGWMDGWMMRMGASNLDWNWRG